MKFKLVALAVLIADACLIVDSIKNSQLGLLRASLLVVAAAGTVYVLVKCSKQAKHEWLRFVIICLALLAMLFTYSVVTGR